MTESQINLALTLALIWTMVMVPIISVYGVVKFMDFMRRLKDGLPWVLAGLLLIPVGLIADIMTGATIASSVPFVGILQ